MASTEAAPLLALDLGLPGWCLRPWREGDAPSLARHADDREVWRWMNDGFPHPYTLAIAEHWVRQGQADFGGEHFAICLDDDAVGGCGIHADLHDDAQASVQIGWWLGQPFWGRGVTTRAAGALLRRAFEAPAVRRVYAPIHAGNLRSARVAEKNELRLERVQPQGTVKDGRAVDVWIYACSRT